MAERACSFCGAPLAESLQTCPVCGMPVAEPVEEEVERPRRRSILRAVVAIMIIVALTFGTILGILVAVTRGSGYPKQAEQGFLDGCARSATPAATCRCVLAELEKRFSYREFVAVTDEYSRSGFLPQRALDAVSACRPSAPTTSPTAA
jgi:hypothetical protein